MPKTIIFNGRLITVTMEVPGLSSLDYKRKYTAHLESLWQSSTIHASKELMERFKDGEELPEGSYVVEHFCGGVKMGINTRVRIAPKMQDRVEHLMDSVCPQCYIVASPVPLPAVEEGSQDELWDDLLLMVLHDYAKAHGMTDKEAFDFAHFCGKAGKDNLIKYQSQYKLTKI